MERLNFCWKGIPIPGFLSVTILRFNYMGSYLYSKNVCIHFKGSFFEVGSNPRLLEDVKKLTLSNVSISSDVHLHFARYRNKVFKQASLIRDSVALIQGPVTLKNLMVVTNTYLCSVKSMIIVNSLGSKGARFLYLK